MVLIDEIDKALRDLPNDLLNELDVGDFAIPEIPSALPDDVMRHLLQTFESHGIALARPMQLIVETKGQFDKGQAGAGVIARAWQVFGCTQGMVARTGVDHEAHPGGKRPNPISDACNLSPTLLPPFPRWLDA